MPVDSSGTDTLSVDASTCSMSSIPVTKVSASEHSRRGRPLILKRSHYAGMPVVSMEVTEQMDFTPDICKPSVAGLAAVSFCGTLRALANGGCRISTG